MHTRPHITWQSLSTVSIYTLDSHGVNAAFHTHNAAHAAANAVVLRVQMAGQHRVLDHAVAGAHQIVLGGTFDDLIGSD